MMSKQLQIFVLFIVIFGASLIYSCKDDNTYFSYNREVQATQDYVIGQQMMVLILNTYFKSISDSLLLATGKSHIDGANIFYDGGEFDTLLIHYPVWGNDDGYGHWRSGDIRVTTNQGFYNLEANYNFDFVDFFFDKDTIFVDNLAIQYLGKNGQNDLFSISSDTIQQLFADSTAGENSFWMQQEFQRFKDVSSSYYTLLDKFEIYGHFDGLTRNDVNYSSKISEEQPLLNQFDCDFLKQGPATIGFEEVSYEGTIYFSETDTCANQYILDIDGSPFPKPIYTKNW